VSDQLRDAIAARLPNMLGHTNPGSGAAINRDLAALMISAPELQAIRKALYDTAPTQSLLENMDLPPSVVAWVMEVHP
jgi:hypothetical protein